MTLMGKIAPLVSLPLGSLQVLFAMYTEEPYNKVNDSNFLLLPHQGSVTCPARAWKEVSLWPLLLKSSCC